MGEIPFLQRQQLHRPLDGTFTSRAFIVLASQSRLLKYMFLVL